MKARHLTETHIQHLFLSDSFSNSSLSGSVESNAEAVGCPVAVHGFDNSEEHIVVDKGSDICSAIVAENGTTVVFIYHWSLWTCTTVSYFQSNSRNENHCEKLSFSFFLHGLEAAYWWVNASLSSEVYCHLRKKWNLRWKLSINMLEDFLALQYSKQIYGKVHSPEFLWNETCWPKIFWKLWKLNFWKLNLTKCLRRFTQYCSFSPI